MLLSTFKLILEQCNIVTMITSSLSYLIKVIYSYARMLSPVWLEPYIIDKKIVSKVYKLIEMDGTPLKEPINVTHFHWYYV